MVVLGSVDVVVVGCCVFVVVVVICLACWRKVSMSVVVGVFLLSVVVFRCDCGGRKLWLLSTVCC